MIAQQELLFDVIENEAKVNVFFDRPNFHAEKAAIIIASGPIGMAPRTRKKGDKFTVWFGHGLEYWTFKTFKEATVKVHELLYAASMAEVEVTFRFEGRDVRKFERIIAKLEVEK